MRDTDQPQPVPGLGKKIEKPEMPKPHQRIGNGVFKRPDGTFETQIQPPPPKPADIYGFYRVKP